MSVNIRYFRTYATVSHSRVIWQFAHLPFLFEGKKMLSCVFLIVIARSRVNGVRMLSSYTKLIELGRSGFEDQNV